MKKSLIGKVAVLFLVPVMIFLCGCGDGNNEEEDADATEADVVVPDGTDTAEDTPVEDTPVEDVPGEEGGGEVTVEDVCMFYASVMCDYFNGCCTVDEKANATVTMLMTMVWNCEDPANSEYYTECVDDLNDSIDNGRLSLNAAGFEACSSAVHDLIDSCPNFGVLFSNRDEPESCINMREGLVAEDGECYETDDCQDGFYCKYDETGLCTAVKGAGEACDENDECGEGKACVPDTTGNVCGDLSGVGGPCDELENEDCQSGLYCNVEGTGDTGQCTSLIAASEECISSDMSCEGMCITDGPLDPDGVCQDFCDGI